MKNKFYREENSRIQEKNYVYYSVIGTVWALNIVIMCARYHAVQDVGTLNVYCFFQFFGAFELMRRLSEEMFFVREMGIKKGRLKKYECLPVLKKQCVCAYMLIMARYLMILTVAFLLLYYAVVLLTHVTLPLQKTLTGLLLFLLASAAGYIWFTAWGLIKNRK